MTRFGALLIVPLFLGVAVVATAQQECRPDAAGVLEIRAVAAGVVAADNRRDLERVLAYYAPDAVLMPPREAPVAGRERIRPRYEGLFATFTPAIDGQIEEACAGAWPGIRPRPQRRAPGPEDPRRDRELDDAYLMLLRLERDGVWRISHLMWHRRSEPAPRPARTSR